ncbi:MAG: hypothetical protein ACKVT1_20175 [Dehalococcoidia bacterium]
MKGALTREEMDEITIFLTQYVGYPLGTRVRAAAAKELKAADGAPSDLGCRRGALCETRSS